MSLLDMLLAVLGSFISFLLLVIGYFMRQQIRVTDTLTNSVNSLTRSLAVIENKNDNSLLNCSMKHDFIDKKITEHSARISHNEKDIVIIKEKIQ